MNEILIHQAIEFAAEKHKEQKRKSSKTPYIAHLMEVYGILVANGCDTNTIIAGILHDVIEDAKISPEEIYERFGNEVAELVTGLSEDKTKTWKERKQTTIEHLKTAPLAIKQICCAEMLSNLLYINLEKEKRGDIFGYRFKDTLDEMYQYYREIIDIKKTLELDLKDFPPYELLDKQFWQFINKTLSVRERAHIMAENMNRLDEEAKDRKGRFWISQRPEDVYNTEPLKNILQAANYDKFKKATEKSEWE